MAAIASSSVDEGVGERDAVLEPVRAALGFELAGHEDALGPGRELGGVDVIDELVDVGAELVDRAGTVRRRAR